MDVEAERRDLADQLERVLEIFKAHIRCLRDEDNDQTGLGYELIAIQALEIALNVKVLSAYNYEHLVAVEKELEALKKAMGKL